jgi:hypothetical protein
MLRFIAVVVVSFYFGISTELFAEQQSAAVQSKPLLAFSGTDSRVKETSYHRVTTANDWAKLWARHLGTSERDYYRPLFEVDFDRCLLIVIFRGERGQTRQLQIESLSEYANSIVIRFWEMGYNTISTDPNYKRPPPERPYAFIVLPKTNKLIVLEEKIWSKEDEARNRPPQWKEVARSKAAQTAPSKIQN